MLRNFVGEMLGEFRQRMQRNFIGEVLGNRVMEISHIAHRMVTLKRR